MAGVRLFVAGVLLGLMSILGVVFLWVLYDQGTFSSSSSRGYREGSGGYQQTYAASDQPPPPPRVRRRRPPPPPCDMSCY